MVYLAFVAALLCDTAKGFCAKKTSTYMQTRTHSILFTLARLSICTIVALCVVTVEGADLRIDAGLAAIAFAAGICTVGLLVFWLLALEYNAMVTMDTASSMGSIIPAVLCALFFGQAILPLKLFGFVMVVLASYILAGYQPVKLKKGGPLRWITLGIAVSCEGFLNFCQQLYNQFYPDVSKSVYHFYTYIFSVGILILLFLVMQHRSEEKTSVKLVLKPLPYIAVMAAALYAYNYLQTVLLIDFAVAPQVLYPALCGGVVITIALTAMIFFGEKPTRRSILGTCLALVGIVSMHLV